MIESVSAITLATHDMARAVWFYRALGFPVIYGGEEAAQAEVVLVGTGDLLRVRR